MVKNADGTTAIIKKPRVVLDKDPLVGEQIMNEIQDYIKGAVHSFSKNNRGKSFVAHDLFGGENTDWAGTPLQKLYDARVAMGSLNPKKAAGQDVGWILLKVLDGDRRSFVKEKGRWARYRRENP